MRLGWGRRRRLVGLCLTLTVVGCTAQPVPDEEARVGAAQRLEAPPSTPRLASDFVSLDERQVVATVTTETVIQGSDPTVFESAWTITVGFDGKIIILDYGSRELVVFDRDGALLERVPVPPDPENGLWGASAVAVAGEHVFASDIARNMLLSWNRELAFQEAVSLGAAVSLEEIQGLRDGSLVGQFVPPVGDRIAVSRFDREAREVTRFGVFNRPPVDPAFVLPRPLVGVDFEGYVYLALNTDYRIISHRPDGSGVWDLDVAGWPRHEITGEALKGLVPTEFRDNELERTRRVGRAAGANVRGDRAGFEYPEHFPPLRNLEVDGQGRLWAFPWVKGPDDRGLYPVDVYTRTGERVFTGLVAIESWDAAWNDRVYRLEDFGPQGGTNVAAYRLSLPEPVAGTAEEDSTTQ